MGSFNIPPNIMHYEKYNICYMVFLPKMYAPNLIMKKLRQIKDIKKKTGLCFSTLSRKDKEGIGRLIDCRPIMHQVEFKPQHPLPPHPQNKRKSKEMLKIKTNLIRQLNKRL
jgi:hypothetical protein